VMSLFLGGRFGVILESAFGFARAVDFNLIGGKMSESAGVSTTQGGPECGPLRFRIDEKCSQS
jgi:hypothetical protein